MSDASTDAAAMLEHLYAALYCQLLLAEGGERGGVARVAHTAQRELWPVIAHLGGNQQTFTEWRSRREQAMREQRPPVQMLHDQE